LSGIVVTVAGAGATDTTNADGVFRVEARADDGRVRLRFRRGALDVELEIEGLVPGTTLHIQVSLDERGASLDDVVGNDDGNDDGKDDGNDDGPGSEEFEGRLVSLTLSGAAPERIARAALDGEGGTRLVDIIEGETAFEQDGDLLTFDALLDGAAAGRAIEVEGDGAVREDGSFRATSVKVEVDGDDDRGNDDDGDDDAGNRHDEFEGRLVSLTLSATTAARVARVVLTEDGVTSMVEIVEGVTVFEGDGDLLTFAALLSGHAAGLSIDVEGDGEIQDDGSFRAASVKVEVDD
jgi:hypothetical protein